jgi:serine/threonine protein kinase
VDKRKLRIVGDRSVNRVGETLCGKYRLESVLGAGGMATVYAATHRNHADLAIKVLHEDLAGDPSVRARFLREAYAANSVKHRGVVKIVDDDVAEDGATFLVMERLAGASVEDLRWLREGKLNLHAAVAIVAQLLDVLAAAHAGGIIHRDVKPANLIVTTEGEVKVLDFGIARIREAIGDGPALTMAGSIMGTPSFMAPEQAYPGLVEIDERTDVWAAGATLFALVSGRNVHEGTTASDILLRAARERSRSLASVAPAAPAAIAEVVDGALAFEKGQRWRSASEMRAALLAAYRLHFGRAPSQASLARLLHGCDGTVAAPSRGWSAGEIAPPPGKGGDTARGQSAVVTARRPAAPTLRSPAPMGAEASRARGIGSSGASSRAAWVRRGVTVFAAGIAAIAGRWLAMHG